MLNILVNLLQFVPIFVYWHIAWYGVISEVMSQVFIFRPLVELTSQSVIDIHRTFTKTVLKPSSQNYMTME